MQARSPTSTRGTGATCAAAAAASIRVSKRADDPDRDARRMVTLPRVLGSRAAEYNNLPTTGLAAGQRAGATARPLGRARGPEDLVAVGLHEGGRPELPVAAPHERGRLL